MRSARRASRAGDTVAVFGVGGLGVSAIQLARALGASTVYAVDLNAAKLALAKRFGAIPIDARVVGSGAGHPRGDGRARRGRRTRAHRASAARWNRPSRSLAPQGRAALAGLTRERISIAPYRDILNREAEIIGVSDHLASEIPELMRYVLAGALDLSSAVSRMVPLEAAAINRVLDDLEAFRDDVRSVILP